MYSPEKCKTTIITAGAYFTFHNHYVNTVQLETLMVFLCLFQQFSSQAYYRMSNTRNCFVTLLDGCLSILIKSLFLQCFTLIYLEQTLSPWTYSHSKALPRLYYLFYLMSVLNQNTIKNF